MRRRSNRNKYLLIITLILVVVVIAAFALSTNPTSSQKPSASEYFIVTHTTSAGSFSADNKTVVLTTLGLNITAVGGDATDIQVQCASQADRGDDYLQRLAEGPPGWDLPIALAGGDYNYKGWSLRLNDQGFFTVKVTISCNEAETGTITVNLNPNDIVNGPFTP